jgi:ribosomal protein S18 acetylase RimI-like enzyme
VTLRRYRAEDQEAVFSLHVLGLKTEGVYVDSDELNYDVRNIDSAYLQNGGDFIVGERNGEIVCIGALKKLSETDAEIRRMRVSPNFQRRGLGQAILDILEIQAIDLGYKVLQLETTARQVPALSLYKKNGFVEVRREMIFGFESIFFVKQLNMVPE